MFAETEGENLLSFSHVLYVIRRRLWIILLVAITLAGAAVGFSVAQTPMYEASIMVLVGQDRGITANPNDVGGLQNVTKTMVEGIDSRPVAKSVIQQLGLEVTPEEFLSRLSVEQIRETQYIEVTYRDSSPAMAQQGANTAGDVFSEQISEVSPSASAITATVWEQAETPDEPVSPNPVRNGFLALVLGLILGTGIAFLLEYLDDSWRSPEEAEQISGVPTFGVIPRFDTSAGQEK